MKKIMIPVILAFVLLIPATNGLAQSKKAEPLGLYIGLIGGSSLPDDMRTRTEDIADLSLNANTDTIMKPGYILGVKAGWQTFFTKKILAVELEYNHLNSRMEKWTKLNGVDQDPGIPVDGKVGIQLFMTNLLARYPGGIVHPYIGEGAGYAIFKLSDMTAYSETSMIRITGGTQGAAAYQLTAGVDFDVWKNVVIGLGYKFVYIPNLSFDNTRAGRPVQTEIDYGAHNFLLSVCLNF